MIVLLYRDLRGLLSERVRRAVQQPVVDVLLLAALLGFQLMRWWVFRGRLDARTPVYW